MVSIVGAQEVRSEGRSSRTSVLQALIGRKFTAQKLKNPETTTVSGFSLCLKLCFGANLVQLSIKQYHTIWNDRSFTNKQLKKILVENDLPALSVHALRHSNASLMINNGFDIKAISEHLGHCNTAITSDIYTRIFKEYKAKMAESIEKDLI